MEPQTPGLGDETAWEALGSCRRTYAGEGHDRGCFRVVNLSACADGVEEVTTGDRYCSLAGNWSRGFCLLCSGSGGSLGMLCAGQGQAHGGRPSSTCISLTCHVMSRHKCSSLKQHQ